MTPEYILLMRDIDKYFGPVKSLDGAGLSLKKGQVHALLGANGAGKSTLMKILCGELPFDGGEIILGGERLTPTGYRTPMDYGVAMIHQELCTVHDLTVAQYMFLGREPMKGLVVDDAKMLEDARLLLKPMEAAFSPDTMMKDLSLADQQLVELSKYLDYDLRILIFDEPTTALGDKETARLFDIIRMLQEKEISIIYISHRLEELLTISDQITIMRDGKYITTLETCDTNREELVTLLAGRKLNSQKKSKSSVAEDAPDILEVRSLSTPSLLKNISFSLKKGEILGLAGLVGSGRTETARAICGIDPRSEGEVYVNGTKVVIRSPKEAADHGICYLSEDRNAEGIIENRSIIGNTVISSLNNYKKGIFLDDNAMLKGAVEINSRTGTKYSDPHQPITSLSGGNVQKVIIARWLMKDLPVFIFDEPTKGIDVGAKDEIYNIIHRIVGEGHSVILISSDTEELLGNCDRILVMSEGRITGELDISEASQESIMKLAMEDRNA